MEIIWKPEQELRRSIPRRAKFKDKKTQMGLGCLGLFLLPFMLIGIGSILYPVATSLILFFGTPVQGVITDWREDSESESTTHHAFIQYKVKNSTYRERVQVSAGYFQSLPIGSEVIVRTIPTLPGITPQIPAFVDLWKSMLSFVFFSGFWNLITWVFVYVLFIRPLSLRRVLTHGFPAPGSILSKEIKKDSDGDVTYHVQCTFTPTLKFTTSLNWKSQDFPVTFQKIDQIVNRQQYEETQIGEVVTVLFNPKKPKQNLIYKYAEYEVIPGWKSN